jgi:hypothetical protein
LSSWKLSREYRALGAQQYRRHFIPHASQTELNREFENRSQSRTGLFFIALLVLAAIDYFYLQIGPSVGL